MISRLRSGFGSCKLLRVWDSLVFSLRSADRFINVVRKVFRQVDPGDLFLLLLFHPFTLVSAKEDLFVKDNVRCVEKGLLLCVLELEEGAVRGIKPAAFALSLFSGFQKQFFSRWPLFLQLLHTGILFHDNVMMAITPKAARVSDVTMQSYGDPGSLKWVVVHTSRSVWECLLVECRVRKPAATRSAFKILR